MALQAWLVVFATNAEDPEHVLPREEEIREAFKDQMDIPDDENTTVDIWPVNIEAMGYEDGMCRKCGEECGEGRLFCDSCAATVAQQNE